MKGGGRGDQLSNTGIVSYAVLIYFFFIELVEFCDAINMKGVKWVFHYFGRIAHVLQF